ncbi:MAG TPA: helix-turn-helix transcriptional regulator [Vitreimonas sp.]|nr:helix-turn-helix transcriptional regulator [Vitreimonas sp.]
MPVKVTLDAVLTANKVTAKAIAEQIGISETQLSQFRSGKVRGLRFSTLSKLCYVLSCEPGDLLKYERSDADMLVKRDEGGD